MSKRQKQILRQLKIHNFNQKIGELSGGQLETGSLGGMS